MREALLVAACMLAAACRAETAGNVEPSSSPLAAPTPSNVASVSGQLGSTSSPLAAPTPSNRAAVAGRPRSTSSPLAAPTPSNRASVSGQLASTSASAVLARTAVTNIGQQASSLGALPVFARTVASVDTVPRARPSLELRVPEAKKPVVPSARFDVGVWTPAVNTHTLLDESGRGAVPVSEARFLHDAHNLYVAFYAGDLDLQARATARDGATWKDDSFTLAFYRGDGTAVLVTISATGVVADGLCPADAADLGDARCRLGWNGHVKAAADYDGTVNQLGDFDEEWTVQAAIPLGAISDSPEHGTSGSPEHGTRRIPFSIRRCEIAHDGPRACGSWGDARRPGELVLDPTT